MGKLGQITMHYCLSDTNVINVDDALLLAKQYDYVSFSEWDDSTNRAIDGRMTVNCPNIEKQITHDWDCVVALGKEIVEYCIFPTRHKVLGDSYYFWNSSSLLTFNTKFVVLDATMQVPYALFRRFGLQVFRQNALVYATDDDNCYYNSESISDPSWGGGAYFKANETVVVFY